MEGKKNLLTYEGLKKLEDELQELKVNGRREIAEKIKDLPLVAHNARFDEGCLRAVYQCYGMIYPEYRFYDTLAASRRTFGHTLPNHQLHTVAAQCGYILNNHHHALADAEACAAIAMMLL